MDSYCQLTQVFIILLNSDEVLDPGVLYMLNKQSRHELGYASGREQVFSQDFIQIRRRPSQDDTRWNIKITEIVDFNEVTRHFHAQHPLSYNTLWRWRNVMQWNYLDKHTWYKELITSTEKELVKILDQWNVPWKTIKQ